MVLQGREVTGADIELIRALLAADPARGRTPLVEDTIRAAKSILETRPIFHKCDETIRGHVFCSFLALRLKAELERRLAARATSWEWADVVRGLDNLQEVEATFRGQRYMLRSQLTAHAHKAIQAAGVAVPPTLRQL